jgi:hypothetical protein
VAKQLQRLVQEMEQRAEEEEKRRSQAKSKIARPEN